MKKMTDLYENYKYYITIILSKILILQEHLQIGRIIFRIEFIFFIKFILILFRDHF